MTTEEIQQEIERTRGEMAGTLHAIERRLDPRQLMNQAVDTMRSLTNGDSRIGQMVRDNPVPVAVIGLGLGWLALSSAMGRRGAEDGGESPESGMAGTGMAGEAAGAATVWTEPGYASAAGVGPSGYGAEGSEGFSSMSESGQGMRERAGQMARGARDSLMRATDTTRRRVTDWQRNARGRVGDAADRTWGLYQDHPLTMAAAAMAMGAALGAMLPRSRAETRVMGGGAMRSVVQQARDTGSDLVERAGEVARNAISTARRKGGEAVESAKDSAKEAMSKEPGGKETGGKETGGQATMH